MSYKKVLKASFAAITAAFIGVTSVAYAGDTFTASMKEDLEITKQQVLDGYAQYEEKTADGVVGADANITITLGDTAKALISMMGSSYAPEGTSLDLSWLNDITLGEKTVMTENNMTISMNAMLNGSHILGLDMFVDGASNNAYMNVPELFNGNIQVNMDQAMATTAENASDTTGIAIPSVPTNYSNILKTVFHLADYVPAASVNNILDRYMGIILNHMTDGETVADNPTEVCGVTENLTMQTATMSAEEAKAAAAEILEAAKTDEDIKTILTNLDAFMDGSASLNVSFQEMLADASPEADASGTPENQSVTMTIYNNAEGKSCGFNVADGDNLNSFGGIVTSNGDDRGLSVYLNMQGMNVSLEGAGTYTDGLLSGQYFVNINGKNYAEIDVQNYAVSEETKDFSCDFQAFFLTPEEEPAAEGEEAASDPIAETLAAFTAFALSGSVAGTNGGASETVSLGLYMGESELATITIDAVENDEALTPGNMDAINEGVIYDINNQEDMTSLTAGLMANLQGVLDNLKAAGVPEDLINSFMGGGAEAEGAATDTAAADTDAAA